MNNVEHAIHAAEKSTGETLRIISTAESIGKTVFEAEMGDGTRVIGKLGPAESLEREHHALKCLYSAGLSVPRPVVFLPDADCLMFTKAPGRALNILLAENHALNGDFAAAGEWLARLHSEMSGGDGTIPHGDLLTRWIADLSDALPDQRYRLEALSRAILPRLNASADEVTSHGDFHPAHVFIAPGSRVTVIDVETFCRTAREFDVAFFLVRTATIVYRSSRDFAASKPFRYEFLAGYRTHLKTKRLGGFMAHCFIRSLRTHFRLQRGKKPERVEPWLQAAESCARGDVLLP